MSASQEVEATFEAKSLRKLSPLYLWERELLGQYEAGQQVQVEWQGEWYEGVILEVHSPDAYLIRYNNFDESWNELVGPDRLRHQ